jgi:hypothetical protein
MNLPLQRILRGWALALLATGLSAGALRAQPILSNVEVGQATDSSATSSSYRLNHFRFGANLEGSAESPSYRLNFFLPADHIPPKVVIIRPGHDTLVNTPMILVEYNVDGQAGFAKEFELTEGLNELIVDSTDPSGNRGSDTVGVTLDSQAPVIVITSPSNGARVISSPIVVQYTADGGSELTRTFNLVEGANSLEVDSTDAAGNRGYAKVEIILDSQGPELAIISPTAGSTSGSLLVHFKAAYKDTLSGIDPSTLHLFLDNAEVTASVRMEGDSAKGDFSLPEGNHTFRLTLADYIGNISTVQSTIVLDLPTPALIFTEPANFSTVSTADILVRGTVSQSLTSLLVGGVQATLTGSQFQAIVPLLDGRNTLLATGFDANGKMVSATLTVTLDREKPRIYFSSPREGMELTTETVVVTGAVSDRIADLQGQSLPSVKVNGVAAAVESGNFSATIPLQPGQNAITAVATDRAGNLESAVLHLSRITTFQSALFVEGGQGQSATVLTALSQPLKVSVKDAAGAGLANRTVVFRVSLGDGTLDGDMRTLNRVTDAQGYAQVSFTLGKRSGPGANQVAATSPGASGELTFFTDATPSANWLIHPASGDMQRGLTDAPAPSPLIAIVMDEKSNPIEGAQVRFTAKKGGGHFQGQITLLTTTGADGKALSSFTLGPEAGRDNNLVEATVEGHQIGIPATFVSSGYVAGPLANTKISGVVLDNSNHPLEAVTIRIEGSGQQTTNDAQGRFTIVNAPIGTVHLFVDGSTSTRPGDWVTLMFELNSISGINNDLGMPVYLVPRNNAEGKVASASQDQVLSLSQIPGFQLKIPAGSAIFPPDMDDHRITVTQVHTDKIPMPPGEGMQPRFIISIGPPQVKFDPPAPITYPNVDGLKPGEQTHFYSFDHDLGTYVSIGTGTVSEDATTITSDPGFGIVKGGWHCAGPSNKSGQCEKCKASIDINHGHSVILKEESETFSARVSPPKGTMAWSGGGTPTGGSGLSFTTKWSTIGTKLVSGVWTCKSGESAAANSIVTVAEVVKDGVSGGDLIGTLGQTEVYATSRGGGTMEIRLKVNPAGLNLPQGTVKWSGGSPGADQLIRLVSLSSLAPSGIPVTATVGSSSFTYKIHVFDGAPQAGPTDILITPTHDNSVAAGNPFGVTDRTKAFSPKVTEGIFYKNKSWVFTLEKIEYEIKWGVDGGNNFDVVSGNMNPFPGPSGLSQYDRKVLAINDLTPNTGPDGSSIRTTYWSRAITEAHELFHVSDWTNGFYKPKMVEAETNIENTVIPVTLSNLDPNIVLANEKPAFMATILSKTSDAQKAYTPGKELRAYANGAHLYNSLIFTIVP